MNRPLLLGLAVSGLAALFLIMLAPSAEASRVREAAGRTGEAGAKRPVSRRAGVACVRMIAIAS